MMRYFLTLLILLGFLYGNSIDAQIEAIQRAPVEKRFELMNAFKHKIIQMQEQERIDAIRKLKSITKSKNGDRAIKEIQAKQRAIHQKQQRNRRGKSIQQTLNRTQIQNELEAHIENQIDEQIEEGVENEIENQLEDEHDDDD